MVLVEVGSATRAILKGYDSIESCIRPYETSPPGRARVLLVSAIHKIAHIERGNAMCETLFSEQLQGKSLQKICVPNFLLNFETHGLFNKQAHGRSLQKIRYLHQIDV